VTAFYQGKLGNALSVMSLGDETILNYGSGNNTVTMMVDSENGKTKINAIHTVTQGQ
jgi:tRNA1(Val) A37 N6-methylase TrmN6